jgi:hypothetical protein
MGDYKDKQTEKQKQLKEKVEQAKTEAQEKDEIEATQAAKAQKNKRENTIRFEVYRDSLTLSEIEQLDNQAFQSNKGRIAVPKGWQSKSKAAVTIFLKEYYTQNFLTGYHFTEAQEMEIKKRLSQ